MNFDQSRSRNETNPKRQPKLKRINSRPVRKRGTKRKEKLEGIKKQATKVIQMDEKRKELVAQVKVAKEAYKEAKTKDTKGTSKHTQDLRKAWADKVAALKAHKKEYQKERQTLMTLLHGKNATASKPITPTEV